MGTTLTDTLLGIASRLLTSSHSSQKWLVLMNVRFDKPLKAWKGLEAPLIMRLFYFRAKRDSLESKYCPLKFVIWLTFIIEVPICVRRKPKKEDRHSELKSVSTDLGLLRKLAQ